MSVSQQISVKTLSWIFYQSPFRIWLKIHPHSAHISKGWAMTTFNQFSLFDVKVIQDFNQKSLYWIQLNSLTLDLLLVLNLKNHMKFMWNSRVVNCRSKPFMTDTKYLILWTRWIGPKYWFILIVESYRISIWHFLPKRTSNHAILKIKLKMFTLQNFCLLFIYQVMAYIYL